ncbi:MAG: VOC family protein [Nitrosopumilus sp.]|uniref:VOC family protein n=1 Tax=Nitrosopumilus sp. TaxID=2024843 RepID=UPI00247D03DB|nr:VOC family protein [Nitrosopumilus sp.]MCV0393043.1 VOC family protein [Nitrosopumilus sp.]
MPRVSWFDIPADDLQRAQKFYKDVFDWKFDKWDGPMEYYMADTGKEEPGINGGLAKRMPGQMGITNTITVPSVDEFTKKIVDNGGQLITQKMPIPGIGWFAQCTDTEGNIFGIIQMDKKAATT